MYWQRIFAITKREFREIIHDPVRISLCFIAPILLMIVFSYGVNFDINNVTTVAIDQDHSQQSRAYIAQYQHSHYFNFVGYAASTRAGEDALIANQTQLLINIPPNFARDLTAGRSPTMAISIDGSNPLVARIIQGYVMAINNNYLEQLLMQNAGAQQAPLFHLETRYWYNQAMESKYALVPGFIALILLSIPAILAALAIVREKELGTLVNFYVTPITRLELFFGKQIPYVLINTINLIILTLMTIGLFRVPLLGNSLAFFSGGLLYVLVSTSFGLFLSTFTRTQIASIMITFIVTLVPSILYSGLLAPTSSLVRAEYYIATLFPTYYFVNICINVFTKGLGFAANSLNYCVLLLFFIVFSFLGCLMLKKQER